MREKTIENKLRQQVLKNGGLCLKFVSPSFDGVPDRIILMPNGKIAFAETKSEGKKLRPLQELRKRQFEKLGFRVYVVDSTEMIGGIISEIQST